MSDRDLPYKLKATQFGVYSNFKITYSLISEYFSNISDLVSGNLKTRDVRQEDGPAVEWLLARSRAIDVPEAKAAFESAGASFEKFRDAMYARFGKRVLVEALSIFDDAYPMRLRQIQAPPLVIYTAGARFDGNSKNLAIVGTRNPSMYALKITGDMAGSLSKKGYVIVSGLALGIDGAAHDAALAAGGVTYAVVGTGFDIAYPKANEKIYDKIIENGAVISEYLPGSHAERYTFVYRNRVISGLSSGTLVAAAGEGSGALITAKYAIEQGREVFAFCSDIHRADYSGCHDLIKKHQAKLVTNDADILSEVEIAGDGGFIPVRRKKAGSGARLENKAGYDGLGTFQKSVAAAVRELEGACPDGLAGVDEIVDYLNGRRCADEEAITAPMVLSAITELEIKGLVNAFFGKRFETVK